MVVLSGGFVSLQHAMCLDSWMCCHTEIEVVDQTYFPNQSQHADIGPTRPGADCGFEPETGQYLSDLIGHSLPEIMVVLC